MANRNAQFFLPHNIKTNQRNIMHRASATAMLSGSELPYDPHYWNNLDNVKKLNCYDYAFGNADPTQAEFTQPMAKPPKENLYTCKGVERGMFSYNPTMRKVPYKEPCKSGERKITLMVDPDAPSDYHYMRQDEDGLWSHKPGYTDVRRTDASGQPIVAPHLSDRNYDGFNYTNMCGYYCIPADANFAR